MGAVSLSGDFPKLKAMIASVEKIPGARRTVSRQLGEASIELIREGFENSRDPSGRRWKPVKLRDGRPLELTGGLKGSWFLAKADDGGFRVPNAKRYAIYHQKGTGIYGPHKQRIRPKAARWNEREKRALWIPGLGPRSSVAGSPIRRMVPTTRLPKAWVDRYREVFAEVIADVLQQQGLKSA